MLGNRWIGTLAAALLLSAAAGCGDSEGGGDEGGDGGGGNGGNNGEMPACGPDAANSKGDATTGSVKGKITVEGMVMPGGTFTAKGDLYLAVLPTFSAANGCPGDPKAPQPVAQALVRCVDLTDGKSFEYEIKGVPPRAEPYIVIPFLDVNSNVDASDPTTAGPDTCDLLGNVSPLPEATVAKAGDTAELDLSFAFNGSILAGLCQLPACGE